MGVVATRRPKTTMPRPVRAAYPMRRKALGRGAPRVIAGPAGAVIAPAMPWAPDVRKTFRDRLHDDRELIGLKVVLLSSLLLLTAVLEWVA
jgi:hypothetical protein